MKNDEIKDKIDREAPIVALVFALIILLMSVILMPKILELKDGYKSKIHNTK